MPTILSQLQWVEIKALKSRTYLAAAITLVLKSLGQRMKLDKRFPRHEV